MSTASTPPTILPASTIENSKDWSEVNGNNTIINGQNHHNSIHVSDKSMLIILTWKFFKIDSLKCRWRRILVEKFGRGKLRGELVENWLESRITS
jgi:hypothetical protein